MIDPGLLEILCCPETHQSLRTATGSELEGLNKAISAGLCQNRKGKTVTEILDGGLVRSDATFLYPIRSGIPVLLVEEALPLPLGNTSLAQAG